MGVSVAPSGGKTGNQRVRRIGLQRLSSHSDVFGCAAGRSTVALGGARSDRSARALRPRSFLEEREGSQRGLKERGLYLNPDKYGRARFS